MSARRIQSSRALAELLGWNVPVQKRMRMAKVTTVIQVDAGVIPKNQLVTIVVKNVRR